MGINIALTGFLFCFLFIVPVLTRVAGIDQNQVPTWFKAITMLPALCGVVAMFVGVLIIIWE